MVAPVTGVSPDRVHQKFPTIPVPEADPESLHKTCLALKQAVEMLSGGVGHTRAGDQSNRFAPHVYIQGTAPQALHEGDLWLATTANWTFNIWQGGKWLVLVTLPPVP